MNNDNNNFINGKSWKLAYNLWSWCLLFSWAFSESPMSLLSSALLMFAYPTAPSSFFSQSALSLGDLTYSDGFNCHLHKLQVDRTAAWHILLTLTARNAGSDTWRQTGHPNRPTRETWTVINSPSLTRIWLSDFKNSETPAWHCHSVLNKEAGVYNWFAKIWVTHKEYNCLLNLAVCVRLTGAFSPHKEWHEITLSENCLNGTSRTRTVRCMELMCNDIIS